jgi:hypothetical protein
LAFAVLLGACGQASRDDAVSRITIGTGPGGTLYNQIGLALTSLTQRELETPSTARPFTGSSVYLPQLHRGELPFGINTAVDTQAAYRGVGAYTRSMPNVRAGMLLLRAPYQFYVKGDSDLYSIGDLRGKAVVADYRAIASLDRANQALLATARLAPEDVRPVVVAGVPDAIRSLIDDRVAAAATMLGIPALREADASLAGGIRILDLGPDEDALLAVPGFTAATLQPGPASVGVTKLTRIAQIDVYLNTGAHLHADHVYQVIGTIHRNWSTLQQALPALRATDADSVVPLNMTYPYHDGAVRYFREVGLWTDEHERLQRQLLSPQ